MNPRNRSFLVCSNVRSGSTFTLLSLGKLHDVTVDFEINLPSNRPGLDGQNRYVPGAKTVREILTELPNATPIKGAKLTLGTKVDVNDLRSTLSDLVSQCSGLDIVHVVRPYFEILRSMTASLGHELKDHAEAKSQLEAAAQRAMKRETKVFDLPTWYAADQILRLLFGDIVIHGICANNRSSRVSYAEIGDRFAEIATFVGSEAGAVEVQSVVSAPPTTPTRRGREDRIKDCDVVKECAEEADWMKQRIFASNRSYESFLTFHDGRAIMPQPNALKLWRSSQPS